MNWKITIPNFLGGFAPGWHHSSYPSYGNKNMAGAMQNVNLIDPAFITQGPGLTDLTNGTQVGVVSSLIKGILDKAQASDLGFAVGGAKFYELSSTTVTSSAGPPALPHTIAGTNVVAEDIAYYKGEIFYSHYDDSAGDVGKYDLTRDAEADFDDDWCTTVATGTVQRAVPLPLEVGGNDFLYLGNKNNVSSWDNSTWTNADLDLPDNCEIQDLKWNLNRLWVAANQPDLTGSNKVKGSIYVWDGNAPSWEDEIRINGRIGALFIKNGVLYVFYQDVTSTGGYKLGYVSGAQIRELTSFKGSLPQYYQVTEYKNFIIWVSGGLIYAFGATDKSLPSMLFQLADGGYATVGGLAAPFGTPLVASYDGSTSYRIAKFSGYDTSCNWKSLMFPVGAGMIDKIRVFCDALATGARADFTITYNRGASSYTTSLTLSYTNDGAATYKTFTPSLEIDNDFRFEISWASGSATNPVSINRIEIYGHTTDKQ